MKLSFLLFAFLARSTAGQNQQLRGQNQNEGDWKAAPEADEVSNTRSRAALLSSKSARSLGTESLGEALAHIGDRAWSEHEFSDTDYDEAKAFLETVKAKIYNTTDTEEEAEHIIANMDVTHILEELFPNINLDESLKDSRMLSEEAEFSDEVKEFLVGFENQAQKFPYKEAFRKAKELETINLAEIYEQDGVNVENKESSVNIHTMATFLESKGVITTEDANIAKDFYNSRDEFHRKLSACSETVFGLIANVFLLILAIFQVPSSAAGTAGSSLARTAMKKLALDELKGLAVGFAVGQAAGAVAAFVDKVFTGGLTIGDILSAVKNSISSWWTWLWFAIELAATLAAFFVTGGWYLAFKLVSLLAAAANVIKSAIDVGNACNVQVPTKSSTSSTKIFYIKNPATGKYLDVKYGGCDNGNDLILYQFNGSKAQQFYFGSNGSIMTAKCHKSLDCGSCGRGSKLTIWDHHGGGNQQFEVRGKEIWNKKFNTAIDNSGQRNENFNKIHMWDINKTPAQQWEIVYK